jgi:hypothetical protein
MTAGSVAQCLHGLGTDGGADSSLGDEHFWLMLMSSCPSAVFLSGSDGARVSREGHLPRMSLV